MTQRLTRKEKQARTRSCLMESAARVLARRGLERAAIDEIAEDAGFTKGAFYANFASKEELFLAMLDERCGQRLDEVDRVLANRHEVEEQAAEAGAGFGAYLAADPEWQRLFFEFAARAARDEEFRGELLVHYRAMRERLAEAYRRRIAELGIEPPIPAETVALMVFAMANGVALEKLLEPDAVPDDLLGSILATFFAGMRAQTEAR